MKKTLKILAVLLATLILLLGTSVLGQLLMPPRTDFGSTWASYLQEEEDTLDVLFFGSSLVYCDVIPAAIWEETGLRSYVMAGPEQTMPITYYYIMEACRTQSPQAIVVELNGLFFGQHQNFTRVNIGYMPWTMNRLGATIHGAESDAQLGLFLPIYEYHDRVYSITPEELRQNLHPARDDYAGYTLLYKAEPQGEITCRSYETGTENYRENLRYLQKISAFCQAEGIELVLYIAPAYGRIPPEAQIAMEQDLQSVPHMALLDCNDGTWPEADGETQWFDFLHYNLYGAEPFSREMGRRLLALGLAVTDGDTALWQERVAALETALRGEGKETIP